MSCRSQRRRQGHGLGFPPFECAEIPGIDLIDQLRRLSRRKSDGMVFDYLIRDVDGPGSFQDPVQLRG